MSSKRPAESSDDKRSNRRFLWPEALHWDFIAAVFDVGLTSAFDSSSSLLEFLPEGFDVSVDQINSQLALYQATISRAASPDHSSFYERSTKENYDMGDSCCLSSGSNTFGRGHGSSRHAEEASSSAMSPLTPGQLQTLQEEYERALEAIAAQSVLLTTLSESVQKQKNLFMQLEDRLSRVRSIAGSDNSTSSGPGARRKHGRSQSAEPTANSDGLSELFSVRSNPVVPLRSELRIMSEMRAHMDMHRRLLQQKHGQISAFASATNNDTETYPKKIQPREYLQPQQPHHYTSGVWPSALSSSAGPFNAFSSSSTPATTAAAAAAAAPVSERQQDVQHIKSPTQSHIIDENSNLASGLGTDSWWWHGENVAAGDDAGDFNDALLFSFLDDSVGEHGMT